MTIRVTKVDAELYSTSPHVILKPIRVTKVDTELYSTSPHVILKPIRVTKVDVELYSTSGFGSASSSSPDHRSRLMLGVG